MPRSSRHKSSKHSSRDARDYSDSEKDSSLKERKGKEESSSRVSKDSDKKRLDSKDSYGTGKGEHPETHVSSKRRKERAVDDGVSDRWNGGEEDRGEVSRKSKSSSDSKSKRKEENEGKHKESSRKDRESGGEREREKETKGKEGKSDRLLVSEEEGNTKQLREITESNTVDAEPDKQLEKRNRRRRDGSGDGDKHLDDVGDAKDRRFSSKDDISKDGKLKDEKNKDERYKDKYHEDSNWDNKHRDERPTKDHTSSRSDEKLLKDDKDMTENRHKKSKAQDHDRDHYHDHQSERDRDRDGSRNRDRDYYRDHDWDQDRDRERGRDREYNRDRDRETDRERERDYDHEDRSTRYKDSRGRKRSPDDRDDYNDSKPRVVRGHYSDMEKKPLSSSRAESEADRGRSQSRQAHVDSSSKRRRNSPYSGSHVGTDDYRYFKAEESKHSDSVAEQRSKAISSREVTDVPERSSKYRSTDKSNKVDDGHLGELSAERSSSSKASPMGLVERSPSSTSAERRQMNRSGIKRSLDVEEPGRRNVPLEKPLGDDTSQADSSYYNRTGQSNSSSIPPLSGYRAGADSPSYRGSLEDENRFNSNARYKRSGDPNMARGHGNSWRGVPSWSSPMPNGFMPFPHGPPLGGFQAMMPQFPSPPLFGVRPSMEINHAGLPYHIPDADRFSGHLRPLGWPNMMDGSGPPHLHGWDGNNGVFRDESHMYAAPDWDQNRHPINRGWENSSEMWKGQNDDVDRDSTSQKEDFPVHETEDGKTSQQKRNHIGVHAKDVETMPEYTLAIKNSQAQPEVVKEKVTDISGKSRYDDVAQLSRTYLSKLDVSSDLACQELYIQCMRLLDLEEEEEATAVNMHGGRASLKTSLALHSPFPLPTSKDKVFQRAMDLYKKQRVESSVPVVSQTVLGVVVASDPKIRDDHIPSHDEGKEEEEQVLISNVEPTDASSDQQIPEVVPVKEEPEELVPTSDLEVQKHILTPSPVKIEDRTHENPEEALPISNFEGKDSGQAVKSEADDTDSSHGGSILPSCDETLNVFNKTNGDHSALQESPTLGNDMNVNLSCSDGSSMALKPESNDSESVVLSRIHTH